MRLTEAATRMHCALPPAPVPVCPAYGGRDDALQLVIHADRGTAGQEHARPECHVAWAGGRSW